MFYLNSHGQDIELYNWYYKILSSRRLKEYSIKENMNIDKIVIMETLPYFLITLIHLAASFANKIASSRLSPKASATPIRRPSFAFGFPNIKTLVLLYGRFR